MTDAYSVKTVCHEDRSKLSFNSQSFKSGSGDARKPKFGVRTNSYLSMPEDVVDPDFLFFTMSLRDANSVPVK